MPRAPIQPSVRELRFHKPYIAAKNKQTNKTPRTKE